MSKHILKLNEIFQSVATYVNGLVGGQLEAVLEEGVRVGEIDAQCVLVIDWQITG